MVTPQQDMPIKTYIPSLCCGLPTVPLVARVNHPPGRLEVGFASCALDIFVEALLGTSCGQICHAKIPDVFNILECVVQVGKVKTSDMV